MNHTVQHLAQVNYLLNNLNDAGGKVILCYDHVSPVARVASLRPLALEVYGSWRNKAPLLTGSMAVEAMLWQEAGQNRVFPYAAVRAGEYALFAVQLEAATVDWISETVGLRSNDPHSRSIGAQYPGELQSVGMAEIHG